jgi:leucyl-tRNA synthetase
MATNCTDYEPSRIEPYWQKYWADNRTFVAKDFDTTRPKYFAMAMYPYPSGHGLHVGHSENYTATDLLCRYKRARGFNVMQPMGWDAFGLPTEQTAVQTGVHPREVTRKNVETFKRQMNAHGFGIDWTREINTTDPGYVRWTQWIFLQLYKHGLAYVDERPVWWCQDLGTVLANEEVIDGKSERGGYPVERRALRQWVLRITAYADKLLKRLDGVDWPEATKSKQRNWIGKSEGAEITFAIDGLDEKLTVFTTRPDTLYGATYMVVAPEHPLVEKLTSAAQKAAVDAYIKAASSKSDLDRTDLAKDKSGVFSGSYAVNPVNGKKIPVWIADYVLMGYGTGAIMAVPAHDTRDHEFAEKFNLPVIEVIKPDAQWWIPFSEIKAKTKFSVPDAKADTDLVLMSKPRAADGKIEGTPQQVCDGKFFVGKKHVHLVNSERATGLSYEDAKKAIVGDLEKRGIGKLAVNYKLRDWLFSRQRYWGEPFPIVWVSEADYAKASGEVKANLSEKPITFVQDGATQYALPVPPSQLPLNLPETDNFQPSGNGESALGRCTEWLDIWFNAATGEAVSAKKAKPAGDAWVHARRETNTMPQWAGSCWYHLRYVDPKDDKYLIDPKLNNYWGSPDYYIGGPEHAVLHLLYAPFWHLFLYDIGAVTTAEPYPRLVHQGMVLGENGEKMSKSRGNVINPDEVIKEHGADAMRLYLMFMGPLEDDKPWNTKGIEGITRFLRRLWREVIDADGKISAKISADAKESPAFHKVLHETIKKVTEDYEKGRYNTAISQMMIFMNALGKEEQVKTASIKDFLRLLSPIAPHITEELWARMGGTGSIVDAGWPVFDPTAVVENEVMLGILVNGKPRSEVKIAKSAPEAVALELAKADARAKTFLDGKTIRKVVYVPGKIINLVVG